MLNEEYYINDDHTDKGRLVIGNCFKTAKEANSMRDWLKARQSLIDSGARFINLTNADDEDSYYRVIFDKSDDKLKVTGVGIYGTIVYEEKLVFSSRELAEQSIKEHKDDWLTYLGVKEKSDGNS